MSPLRILGCLFPAGVGLVFFLGGAAFSYRQCDESLVLLAVGAVNFATATCYLLIPSADVSQLTHRCFWLVVIALVLALGGGWLFLEGLAVRLYMYCPNEQMTLGIVAMAIGATLNLVAIGIQETYLIKHRSPTAIHAISLLLLLADVVAALFVFNYI